MKTRVTELFGIKHPIVMPGMGIVGNADLVAAVTNAGGLGFLGSAFMSPEDVRSQIKQLKATTGGKPFGVNLMEGDPRIREVAQLVIDEKIPVIGHGKGSPAWLLDMMTNAGILKVPTVGRLSHALKAEAAGADALIVQGTEGGGHTGKASTLVLVNRVSRAVKVPVIAAGGFGDGRGLVAALALGAEGMAMGTRFAVSKESPLHQRSKEFYVTRTEDDTVVTSLVTGTSARGMANQLTDWVAKRGGNLPIWQAVPAAFKMKANYKMSWVQLIRTSIKMTMGKEGVGIDKAANLAEGINRYRNMIFKGDVEWGWTPGGQVVGLINDIPTVQEIMDRIMTEAEDIIRNMPAKL